jgi:hypothetical protein
MSAILLDAQFPWHDGMGISAMGLPFRVKR